MLIGRHVIELFEQLTNVWNREPAFTRRLLHGFQGSILLIQKLSNANICQKRSRTSVIGRNRLLGNLERQGRKQITILNLALSGMSQPVGIHQFKERSHVGGRMDHGHPVRRQASPSQNLMGRSACERNIVLAHQFTRIRVNFQRRLRTARKYRSRRQLVLLAIQNQSSLAFRNELNRVVIECRPVNRVACRNPLPPPQRNIQTAAFFALQIEIVATGIGNLPRNKLRQLQTVQSRLANIKRACFRCQKDLSSSSFASRSVARRLCRMRSSLSAGKSPNNSTIAIERIIQSILLYEILVKVVRRQQHSGRR